MIRKVEPEYSEEARLAFFQGTVLLQIVVGSDGQPRGFKLLRSLGLGLDEKVIAAVSAWQFRPGYKAAKPVSVLATVEVSFRLGNNTDDRLNWYVSRAEFQPPDGATRPTVLKAFAPRPRDSQACDRDDRLRPTNKAMRSMRRLTRRRVTTGQQGRWRHCPNGGSTPGRRTECRSPSPAQWKSFAENEEWANL